MALSMDTASFLDGSQFSPSGSPLNGSRRGSSTKLHKLNHQRRKNSANSGAAVSNPASPTSPTAFPSFDPTYGYSTTYVTANPPTEPMTLFGRSSEDHGGSTFSKKIKPLVRHSPSKDVKSVPINLNMSKAENEERGAYVSDMPSDPAVVSRAALGGHARTISGTSQMTSSSTHSVHHRSSAYIHPARQLPSAPTPPIPSAPFSIPDDRPSSSHSNLANVPALPPPGHFRSSAGGGILRSKTSTPSCVDSPTSPTAPSAAVLSTSVPATCRSSIDSSFRDRITAGLASRHRSRTNSNAPLDPDEEVRAVAALRAEFNAREAAKDEKYRRREEKRDRRRSEAEERKARRRRGNSGATAGSTGSGIAGSSMSGGSEPAGNASAPTRKARSGSGRKAGSPGEKAGRDSVDQLESIRYDNTTQHRRPTTIASVGDDVNEKQENIPKRGKKQGLGSAGKATQSLWMTFWFRVKTALMRMMTKKT